MACRNHVCVILCGDIFYAGTSVPRLRFDTADIPF